ncbi:MAG: tetratricopeptide repeat protein, partial [Acidobacteriota bacterium]|nr:tetratricopeptide repeat protein [Acidobacteriota bacterium]
MRTTLHRPIGAFTLMAAGALVATLSVPQVCAQPNPSGDQLHQLMQHRRELSNRAVEETKTRRFEEGKSDSTFPSDLMAAKKGGVVRVLTREEQKAIQHNERGLELFAKNKLDAAMKQYQEAIRSDPKLAAAHNNLG